MCSLEDRNPPAPAWSTPKNGVRTSAHQWDPAIHTLAWDFVPLIPGGLIVTCPPPPCIPKRQAPPPPPLVNNVNGDIQLSPYFYCAVFLCLSALSCLVCGLSLGTSPRPVDIISHDRGVFYYYPGEGWQEFAGGTCTPRPHRTTAIYPPRGVLGLIWMGLPTTWGPALPRALARSQTRCPTWLGTTGFTSQ